MKFFGVIEGDRTAPVMLNMPILGLGLTDDGRYCMGHITGDLKDLETLGHISFPGRLDFKKWVNDMKSKLPEGSFPETYNIEVCTYKEGCKRALDLYESLGTLDIQTKGGPIVKIDLTSIKNKLRNIIKPN